MIERVQGNLLEAEVDVLVNTVNTVGVMGKGIALQFKKAFPENFKAYKRACDAGEVEPGRMFIFDTGRLLPPRYIINFPTKRDWRAKSRLRDIAEGLAALIADIDRLGVESIALPPLGCGNGGLDWAVVSPLIEAAFESRPGIRVLVYEPRGAPEPRRMRNRTARPRMTPGRAALLALMRRYEVPGYDYRLSLLEIQKLAYFLQEAGQPLRLQYKAHHYGPYADALRHVLNHIEGHFITGMGDGKSAPETPLALLPGAADEAEAFLAKDATTQARLERVAELIEGFETPFGMELLGTVHWVARANAESMDQPDAIVRLVHAWSRRKAEMMQPEHIHIALATLREHGWL